MSPNSDSILSQELSRRTALKALFGAASAAVLFGLPTRAHAAEASKETTDKLNAAQAQLDEVQAQLDSIANEYAALANKNAQTLNDIENVQGKIDDTQAQIDEKKAELKKKRNDLSDRVAASYKSGGTNILSLLLASGSFEELVANAHYVEKINKSDRDAIEDIQTIQAELDAQKTELEAQKANLEKLKDQQTAQMQDMQAKQQEVQTVLNGLSDDVKELMAQRDSEILAAAQAEEAARKAAAAAAKANKPAQPRKKAKITLEILCTMLKGAGTLTKAVFGALRITKIQVRLGVRGEDPAAAARSYGRLQAWLYPVLGVLDRFLWLQFDELRILPDFGSGQPTVEDRVSCRVSAQALFIVLAAVRVLYEFWRKKVLDIFL
mgnify:FL=1